MARAAVRAAQRCGRLPPVRRTAGRCRGL